MAKHRSHPVKVKRATKARSKGKAKSHLARMHEGVKKTHKSHRRKTSRVKNRKSYRKTKR